MSTILDVLSLFPLAYSLRSVLVIRRFAPNLTELSHVPSSPICLVRWETRYSTTPPPIQRIELGFTFFFPEVPAMRGWLYQQEVVIRFFYPKLPTLGSNLTQYLDDVPSWYLFDGSCRLPSVTRHSHTYSFSICLGQPEGGSENLGWVLSSPVLPPCATGHKESTLRCRSEGLAFHSIPLYHINSQKIQGFPLVSRRLS